MREESQEGLRAPRIPKGQVLRRKLVKRCSEAQGNGIQRMGSLQEGYQELLRVLKEGLQERVPAQGKEAERAEFLKEGHQERVRIQGKGGEGGRGGGRER